MPRTPAQATAAPSNALYFGDNLDILRRHIKDESVDLVYLDPPFNSKADYNMLFKEQDGSRAASQVRAFGDTWKWDAAAIFAYQETVARGGKVSEALQAFRVLVGPTDLLAYLSMMAPRLVELRRVLKPTGSLYLHCDPTASHYLKLLLDAVFGARRFRNEVVWKRSHAHSDTKQGMAQYGRVCDTIFFYPKGDVWTWNPQFQAYKASHLASEYRHRTPEGRSYKQSDVTAAKGGGDTSYEWRLKRPSPESAWVPDSDDEYKAPHSGHEYMSVRPYEGRYWAYSKPNLLAFWDQGRLTHRRTGMPRLMHFEDEMPGVALQDLWTDIPPVNAKAVEREGYQTQKPLALLERIISASSNPGDVVLDPFCGCGTAVDAAQKLGRRWVGIDVTQVAIGVIQRRMEATRGLRAGSSYRVIGNPVSLPDAVALAERDRFQFQVWAVNTLAGFPVEQKKGKDGGVDGKLYFFDGAEGSPARLVVIQVKSGKVGPTDVRDLAHVRKREKAEIAVLVTLSDPTKDTDADRGCAAAARLNRSAEPRTAARTLPGKYAPGPAGAPAGG